MARKVCPACKKLNAGSATTCTCGHAFDASTMKLERRARRCPMCATANEPSAQSCVCGYHFESDPIQLRELLEDRVRVGWTMVVLGIFGVLGCFAMLVFATWLAGIGIAALAAFVNKGFRIVRVARASLEDLEGKAGALPQAKVVE